MCLDAAVMGACPTFINQAEKNGNSMMGGMPKEQEREGGGDKVGGGGWGV